MTVLDDLVPWLREQIAEARAVALAATSGPWRYNPEKHWRKPGTAWCEEAVFSGPAGAGALCVAGTGNSDDPQSMADAKHIAMNDSLAVLAQCEAHEALLDAYENAEARRVQLTEAFTRNLRKIAELDPAEERRRYSEVSTANGVATGYGMAVLMAASAYRHRLGYRQGWRP